MNKLILLLLLNILFIVVSAQQQLHIHHINIENGDATIIGIYDTQQHKYTSKILIDGGQSKPEKMLLPYIEKMFGSDSLPFHFDYIILTHYHSDHYTGLLAIKTGKLTADSIIDPGGYIVSKVFEDSQTIGPVPAKLIVTDTWLSACSTAAHHSPPFVKGRSKILIRFDTSSNTSIGNKILIGKIGSNKIELECIAGWGNTLSSNNHIEPNPRPKKDNANNFTLAFILSYGQFRYLIAGDMGGDNGGEYLDQETFLTKYLKQRFPSAFSISGDTSVKGHICGFKANHHGSQHSNTAEFIEDMHPSLIVTSAGNNTVWKLPNPNYLERLAAVRPLSISTTPPNGFFNEGIYFTNLYDFSNAASKTTSNNLFKNLPGVSYDFGNDTNGVKASYLVKVTDEGAVIKEKSEFEVGRVDISKEEPYHKLAMIFCHKKE